MARKLQPHEKDPFSVVSTINELWPLEQCGPSDTYARRNNDNSQFRYCIGVIHGDADATHG
jgi:hypothetical protein